MEVNVTKSSFPEMVARLRAAVGPEILSASKAYEGLAHALNGSNWDTLSGRLNKQSKDVRITPVPAFSPYETSKPIKLYVEADAIDDEVPYPTWVCITLDTPLLQELKELREDCASKAISHVWVQGPALEVDPDFEEIGGQKSLYVSERRFFVRGEIAKYKSAFESRAITFELLEKVITKRIDCSYFVWHKDALVYKATGDLGSFVNHLEELGKFSI